MSVSTDSLVADIRKMSSDADFKSLITKLESSEEHIAQLNNAVLDTMIECMDVRNHSLGILAALYVCRLQLELTHTLELKDILF